MKAQNGEYNIDTKLENMRKIVVILFAAFLTLNFTSCVESSEKYKVLKAQLDSLQAGYSIQSGELDDVFSTLNEVEQGLKSIRESENIIALSKDGLDVPESSKEQLRRDMAAIQDAIKKYQDEIARMKKENKLNSAQFTKRLNSLQKELTQKSELIASLTRQLGEKDAQLTIKTNQIASLDKVVSNLKNEVSNLNEEGSQLKEKVASQERGLYAAYYIVGTKNELIEVGVMTKGGLFKSSKISYQAEKNAFVKIDYREITDINTNAKRAKVISIHPKGTYALEVVNDETILTISDPDAFWEQTKYLVIQVQ